MFVDDVDAEYLRAGKMLGQSRGGLNGAAAGVEYAKLGRQDVAIEQEPFLGPDGPRLRIQVAHHRLVGHLLGLWVPIGHKTLSTWGPFRSAIIADAPGAPQVLQGLLELDHGIERRAPTAKVGLR